MTTSEETPIIADIPLWKSFVVGLFGSILFAVILGILLNYSRAARWLSFSDHTMAIIGWAFFMPFYLVVMVSLWNCAYNTKRVYMGHLARIYAVLTTLLLSAICITILFFD